MHRRSEREVQMGHRKMFSEGKTTRRIKRARNIYRQEIEAEKHAEITGGIDMEDRKMLSKRKAQREKCARSIDRRKIWIEKHVETVKRHAKEATLLRLIKINPEPQFYGRVIIEATRASILSAIIASRYEFDPSDRIFFARCASTGQTDKRDGDYRQGDTTVLDRPGIAYRQPPAAAKGADEGADEEEPSPWKSEIVPFCASAKSRVATASISAIAACLAAAATEMDEGKKERRRVTVFADCPRELLELELEGLSRAEPVVEHWTLGTCLKKLLAASQILFKHLNVEVELRWVPADSGIEGIKHAADAAGEMEMEMIT